MSIVLPDRPGARRARAAVAAPKPIGRSLLIGAGVFIACLALAKTLTAPAGKQQRATAMTLTPAAQAKKRLAEPRLPARDLAGAAARDLAGASERGEPRRQLARVPEPATESAREPRAVRRIALDATATHSIQRAPVIPGGGLMASREGTFGGFAPLERAAHYEGFRVSGGSR